MSIRSGFFVVPISQRFQLPDTLTRGIRHTRGPAGNPRTYYPIIFVGSLSPDYIGSTIIKGSIDFSNFPIGSTAIYTGELITLSAQIKAGIIETAHIGSLRAGKIYTGTLVAIHARIGTQQAIFKTDIRGLYLGHEFFGSAPFRVDPSGNLRAQSGKFIGSLIVGTPNGLIQSQNYSQGTTGFQLHPTAGLKVFSGEITTPAMRAGALSQVKEDTQGATNTSSTTYADTGLEVSITTLASNLLILVTIGDFKLSTTPYITYFRVLVDNVEKAGVVYQMPTLAIFDDSGEAGSHDHGGSTGDTEGHAHDIDGESDHVHAISTEIQSENAKIPISFQLFVPATAATHVVKVQWKVNGGTAYIEATFAARLTVVEFKKSAV